MVDGMPNLDALNKMQEDIKKMLGDVTKKQKEDVDNIIKLQVTPETQKNCTINGTSVLVQMFQDNVKVIFPTKELTKQYYDDIDKQSTSLSWFQRLKNKWQ